MKLIPAIDLINNKCVRLSQGKESTSHVYNDNPIELAKFFESQGCKRIHIVDISENNLVELVRTIRSSIGYIKGELKTFAIDFGSKEYEFLFKSMGPYDYILNLSALKHAHSIFVISLFFFSFFAASPTVKNIFYFYYELFLAQNLLMG